eukprot:g17089.t1
MKSMKLSTKIGWDDSTRQKGAPKIVSMFMCDSREPFLRLKLCATKRVRASRSNDNFILGRDAEIEETTEWGPVRVKLEPVQAGTFIRVNKGERTVARHGGAHAMLCPMAYHIRVFGPPEMPNLTDADIQLGANFHGMFLSPVDGVPRFKVRGMTGQKSRGRKRDRISEQRKRQKLTHSAVTLEDAAEYTGLSLREPGVSVSQRIPKFAVAIPPANSKRGIPESQSTPNLAIALPGSFTDCHSAADVFVRSTSLSQPDSLSTPFTAPTTANVLTHSPLLELDPPSVLPSLHLDSLLNDWEGKSPDNLNDSEAEPTRSSSPETDSTISSSPVIEVCSWAYSSATLTSHSPSSSPSSPAHPQESKSQPFLPEDMCFSPFDNLLYPDLPLAMLDYAVAECWEMSASTAGDLEGRRSNFLKSPSLTSTKER